MRTINFRDGVLYPAAYKVGLDPKRDFQSNQMRSLVAFINQWVMRLWDKSDFPEWTTIEQRTPVSHIVDYDQTGKTPIGRVLKVFLADPLATNVPVDTPFKLTDLGVHCGYDHGTFVWIKFLQREPQFTADIWDATRTYNAGELAYLPDTGECYSSIGNNNLGHNPAPVGRRQAIQTEITQQATLPSPGLAAQDEILVVYFTGTNPPPDPSDPPPSGTDFYVAIYTADQGILLGDNLHTANGVESLATIITAMATALQTALGVGFTATPDTGAKTITVQGNASFIATQSFYRKLDGLVHLFRSKIGQPYIPSTSATPSQRQFASVTLTNDLVIPGEIYNLTFVDVQGVTHEVTYTASTSDTALQILNGLMAAVQTSSDTYFQGVFVSIDTVGTRLIISTATVTSVDASMQQSPVTPTPVPPVPQPPTFWNYVPFPHDLALQVGRGAYSDYLKMEGQTDKGAAEEQGALGEQGEVTTTKVAPPYDAQTDQQPEGVPRYRGSG